MNITFDEANKIFRLDTSNTTYAMALTAEGLLNHIYYGKTLQNFPVNETSIPEYPTNHEDTTIEEALCIRTEEALSSLSLTYKQHEILLGKPSIHGLPSTFGLSFDTRTLRIDLEDTALSLKVSLFYSIFSDSDCIAKSVQIGNASFKDIYLTKVMSSSIRKFPLFTKLIFSGESYSSSRGQNLVTGLSPDDFCYKLTEGSIFRSPEVLLCVEEEPASIHAFYERHLQRHFYPEDMPPVKRILWDFCKDYSFPDVSLEEGKDALLKYLTKWIPCDTPCCLCLPMPSILSSMQTYAKRENTYGTKYFNQLLGFYEILERLSSMNPHLYFEYEHADATPDLAMLYFCV